MTEDKLIQNISQKPDRGVLRFNTQGKITFVSGGFLAFTHQRESDILGQSLNRFLKPEDFKRHLNYDIKPLIQKKVPMARFVSSWKSHDGDPLFLSFKCYPPVSDSGNIISAVKKTEWGFQEFQDVPLQVCLEKAIQRAKGVFWLMKLPSYKFQYLSPNLESFFEINVEDFLSNPSLFLDRVHPEDRKYIQKLFDSPGSHDFHKYGFRYRMNDGTIRYIMNYRYVLVNADGTPSSISGVFLDSTEWYEANEKIALMSLREGSENQMLQKSKLMLDEFINFVGHDLKSPLRIINMNRQILDRHYRERLDEEGQEILNSLGNATQRMNNLIEGISEFSVVMGQTENNEIIDISEFFQNSIIPYFFQNYPQGKLEVHTQECLNMKKEHLLVLFKNLIDNGSTFNHNVPHITVRSKIIKSGTICMVKDNGVGVPEAAYQEVFQMGRQLNVSENGKGVGMGLAVCKSVMDLYNGKIWLRSKEGDGTTFFLFFPNPTSPESTLKK
ncbi:PAS domain S-box protein [Candidatus Bealeia paramacronuclearis]|uniref:histidine kinase n=1 Tax=Candidatus Bealeia paramacronuclearis TaxID=1921001 RepID=A0ABZ2C0X4_9PROT|nr:PAS domain S-box protein [Candidatus Bealeia paramacronuclearis]